MSQLKFIGVIASTITIEAKGDALGNDDITVFATTGKGVEKLLQLSSEMSWDIGFCSVGSDQLSLCAAAQFLTCSFVRSSHAGKVQALCLFRWQALSSALGVLVFLGRSSVWVSCTGMSVYLMHVHACPRVVGVLFVFAAQARLQ